MLTVAVVFVYPGDAAQIAVTVMITFAFFLISEVISPYQSSVDAWLYRGGETIVFLSFYVALLYKVDVSNERKPSQVFFGWVLVAGHVALLSVVAFYSCWSCASGRHALGADPLPRPRSDSRIASTSGRSVQLEAGHDTDDD